MVDQKKLGIPIIFITHDPAKAFTMADKMVIFDNREMQQLGLPEDVLYPPKTHYMVELVCFSNLFEGAIVKVHGLRDE